MFLKNARDPCSPPPRFRILIRPVPRYHYNAWRPITAIHRPGIWLPSGKDVSDPSWVPLLNPTPNHQDYLSTHATFGGAAAEVIRAWNGGDEVDVYLSSNVTIDNVGVITRRITSLEAAAKDNGDSRIFGGVSICITISPRFLALCSLG
jgi:hypothetical protein